MVAWSVFRCASILSDAVAVSSWVDVDVCEGMCSCPFATAAFTLASTFHNTAYHIANILRDAGGKMDRRLMCSPRFGSRLRRTLHELTVL